MQLIKFKTLQSSENESSINLKKEDFIYHWKYVVF